MGNPLVDLITGSINVSQSICLRYITKSSHGSFRKLTKVGVTCDISPELKGRQTKILFWIQIVRQLFRICILHP